MAMLLSNFNTILLSNFNTIFNDASQPWQLGFQDSAAPTKKLDLSHIFTSLYNNYNEYLDNLTLDKIVCLFNIIIDGLILSSFLSVLSIMLSENIINKIVFLEKYPRIL